jgi:hypothetical protein
MTDYKSLSASELTEALNFHRRQRNMSRGINEAAHMRQTQVVRLLEAEEARRLDEAEKPTYHYYVTHNKGDKNSDWTVTHSKKKPFATSRDAADHIMKSGGRQGGTVHTVNAKTGNIVQARSYDSGQAGYPRDPGIGDPRHIRDLKEEVELDEQIKGWKHAASDLSKMRAAKGKNVKLVSLKKDGTESKMHDATKAFGSEEEAQRHHDRVTELNPKSKIRHNMYVDGKHVKTLGEEVGQIDEISTELKKRYVEKGADDVVDRFTGRGKYEKPRNPANFTKTGRVKKSALNRPEAIKYREKLDNRRNIVNKVSQEVHGKKRFGEEVEQIDEISYRDSGAQNMMRASRKADKEADKMRAQQAKAAAKAAAKKVVTKEEVEVSEANALGWSFKVTTKKHGPHDVTVSRSAAKSVDDAEQYIKKHPMYVKYKPTKIEYVKEEAELDEAKHYLVGTTGNNLTGHTSQPHFNSHEDAVSYQKKFKHVPAIKKANIVKGTSDKHGFVTPVNEEVELKENPVDYSRNLSNKTDGELKSLHAIHKNQHRIASLSNKRDLMYHHQLAMNTIDAERKRRGN